MNRTWMNLVGGELVAAIRGGTREVVDPATGLAIATVPDGTSEDVDRAVAAAEDGFSEWGQSTPRERSEALSALAAAIEANAAEFIELEVRNVGKPREMAAGEIEHLLDNLRFFAGAGRCLTAGASGQYMRGYTSSLSREPVGVVGLIAPWNYPLMLAVWKLAPALMAGNACVLKPAEQTPLSALLLAEVAADLFPSGAVNVITGDGPEVGAPLVEHPGVAMVSLTGSVATGQAVARAAATTLKRVHLELGGKAPMVVFDDADLEAVIEGIKLGGYWNSGQECAAACRVIAGSGVRDELLERLVPEVESMTIGGPDDDGPPDLGPVISVAHQDRVLGFLERAAGEGATVLTGGERQGPGTFITPAVVSTDNQEAEIIQKEVFGPVVTVQEAKDESEAVAWANAVDYGLCASVWTENVGRAERASRALRFGTVWVNDHLPLVSEMPWTGFGISAQGHDQSIYAIEDYTQLKHVMVKG